MPKQTESKKSTATKDDATSVAVPEEKKVQLNKETLSVGLHFNVKKFKDWLKNHYNQVHDVENIKIMNAHYMLAAVDEIVLFTVLTGVSHLFGKEKTGLQDLTLERLRSFVQTTDFLNDSYGRFFSKYDVNQDYSKQLCVERSKFDEYIQKYCFHNNNTIHINKDTRNFLCYMLVQTNITLGNTTFMIAKYLKKTTVNAASLCAGVELFFVGKLQQDILKKLEEITTILKNKTKQDSDKAVEDTDKSKTKDKNVKVSKKKEESDDENDEDEDEEDEDDDEKEESDEEEEENEESADEEVVETKSKKEIKGKKGGKSSGK